MGSSIQIVISSAMPKLEGRRTACLTISLATVAVALQLRGIEMRSAVTDRHSRVAWRIVTSVDCGRFAFDWGEKIRATHYENITSENLFCFCSQRSATDSPGAGTQ